MPQDGATELGRLIQERGWAGLLVLGEDGSEPDLCRWTRGRHLGLNLVWVDSDGRPRLVYFTDMEREEAAATGVDCIGPQDIGLTELRRETSSTGELVARSVVRIWRQLGVPAGRPIGLGGRLAAGDTADLIHALTVREWQPVSGRDLLHSWRRTKLGFEIDEARRVARVTCEVFLAVADRLRQSAVEMTTIGDLRRLIAIQFAEHGFEQPHGNIVAIGPASAVPHSAGDDADPIEAGQTLVVDLYPRGLLFADCTRTFCIPPMPEAVVDAHATVRAALTTAQQGAVAQAQVTRLADGVFDVIEEAGYQTLRMDTAAQRGMVHSLGHGVGYELHELPNLRSRSSGSLESGDLITVEPGLYDPEAGWGVRLEDVLLVGEERTENLTPLPYHLDPATWPEVE